MRFWTPAIASALLLLWPVQTAAQPVIVDIVTDTGNDTLKVGQPGSIIFTVDANGHSVSAASYPFIVRFSNGNIMGFISETTGEVTPSAAATAAFESISWNSQYGQGTDPDTIMYGFIDFGGPLWEFADVMWSISFAPSDTGTITFDTANIWPMSGMAFADDLANNLPFDWRGDGKEIMVVEPYVTIDIRASTGNDTLYTGLPGAVTVGLDADHFSIALFKLWAIWKFTNGNVVGPLDEPVYSEKTLAAFAVQTYVNTSGPMAESTYVGVVNFGGPSWRGDGEVFRFELTPSDTSGLLIDPHSLGPTPDILTEVYDDLANYLPWVANVPGIEIVACSDGNLLNGDANFDRTVNAADIIYLVGHAFKSGPEPVIWNLGDVNCDSTIAAADIVYLVGYVFKSGSEPCDVCAGL